MKIEDRHAMRRILLATVVATALGATFPARAVSIAPRGGGQVLLFPYYNVERGLQTLVSVANSTDRGKALRIRFAEGRNGRDVLSFNIYLAPHDSWTAALFAERDAYGATQLITLDRTCTMPRIVDNASLPQIGGHAYVPFRNFNYAGANDDGGPTALERTREGTIEVIEMGTVVPGSRTATAIAHRADGTPNDCESLTSAWSAPDGYWRIDPRADLRNPTGGLYGSASLVDVANGTMWAYDATALDAFRQDPADAPRGSSSSVVLHTPLADPHPNLGDALTDPARGIAAATVAIDGGTARIEYPAARGVDAVSAVLMSESIENDFNVDPALAARSEWIVAFPTRSFYVDARRVAAPVEPFTALADPDSAAACMSFGVGARDRDASFPVDACPDFPEQPPGCPPVAQLCFATQSIPLNDHAGGTRGGAASLLATALVAPLATSVPADHGLRAGTFSIALAGDDPETHFPPQHRLFSPIDGTVLDGMPVIGFLAVQYTNSDARPGLLGNYTGTYAHRFHARCFRSSGAGCVPQ
jgi:hypothetical protein